MRMRRIGNALRANRRLYLWILLSFILSRAIMYVVCGLETGAWRPAACVDAFHQWDAKWYETSAEWLMGGEPIVQPENGQAVWAFFPLYPLLTGSIWRLLGTRMSYAMIGSLFSSLCFLLAEAAAVSYVHTTRRHEHTAFALITLLSFGPYSFYFSVSYTESLFLLLLVLCLLCLKRKRYLLMGLCGALLSATRNTGVLFVLVILTDRIVSYCRSQEKPRSIGRFLRANLGDPRLVLGTALVPLGLFAYVFFLWQKVGDGFAFIHVMRSWARSLTGLLVNLFNGLTQGFPPDYWAFALLLFLFLAAYALLRDRRYDEWIYPLTVLEISASTILQSVPRYMIGSFTPALACADLVARSRRGTRFMLYLLAGILEMLMVLAWVRGSRLMT